MTKPPPDEKVIFNAARLLDLAEARRVYTEQGCGEEGNLRARVGGLMRVH
jgi:hypothetical protein